MELESVYQIQGKKVNHVGNFMGFELFEHDDSSDWGGEITTYFVKKGKVLGTSEVTFSGGAEGSATADITFSGVVKS